MHDHPAEGLRLLDAAAPILGAMALIGYVWMVDVGRGRPWPWRRALAWAAGTLAAIAAVSGPLAEASHSSFTAHMAAHLLLGMLAPLLLTMAAPITVLLRGLPAPWARGISRVLRTPMLRILTEPIVATVLNVGGLWILYTSDLYQLMHTSAAVHVLVHVHMFLAGYLFTVAIVSTDPMPHRRGYLHRAAALILGLAAHDILAKYLYAHPPAGVDSAAAEAGAMLMYYGGDAIDLILMVMLCSRWFHATGAAPTRPPRPRAARPRTKNQPLEGTLA